MFYCCIIDNYQVCIVLQIIACWEVRSAVESLVNRSTYMFAREEGLVQELQLYTPGGGGEHGTPLAVTPLHV